MDEKEISPEIKQKYSFANNTFKTVPKEDPKDKIEIEVGDSKQPDFKPQLKVMRWDNEVNLSIRLVDDEKTNPVVTTDKDKILWTNKEKDIHFYDLPVVKNIPRVVMNSKLF